MFKRLVGFVANSARSRLIRNRRRARSRSNRRQSLESLERRELFAAEAFVGIFNSGVWNLDGQAAAVSFGLPGDQPVMGDWNGDGTKTPGIFRNGVWVLDVTGNGYDANDRVLRFGLPGDRAVAGDWNADGIDTVGVYRNGLWYFDRDGDGYTPAVDATPTAFGLPGDIPVAGDWNGDGSDSPGVFRNGTWVLDWTGNGYDPADRVLQFGLPGDQPVAGDWNRNGRDTPGVLQNNHWFLDLEGDGFTGEVGRPNSLGPGIAVSGSRVAGDVILPRGVVRNDSLNRAGEIDRFNFTATAGERFQLSVASTSPTNMNLSVRILRPDGGTIGGTLSVQGLRQQLFSIPSNLSGNFIVEVRAANGLSVGSYNIGLESLSTPSPDAVSLAPGRVAQGTLHQAIQVDQYRVVGRAGERLQINVADLNPASGPLKVTVFKPGGVSKTGAVSVIGSAKIPLTITPTEPGTYIVQVEAFNGRSTGSYRIGLQTLVPALATTAEVLRPNVLTAGTIAAPADSKQYLIDVRANQTLTLQLSSRTGAATFQPRVTLYNSSGNIVRSFVVTGNSQSVAISTHPGMGTRLLVHIEDSRLSSSGSFHFQYRLT